MSKPVVAVTLLTVMAGAWYWALLPPAPASMPGMPGVAATRPAAAAGVPTVHLDRLDRRVPPGVPASSGANPFGRGRIDEPVGARAAPGSTPAVSVAPPATEAPSWPRLDLIGVAEAEEDGHLVRTAILAGPAGVQHARRGDVLERVYRLESIAADGVDVRLLPEDRVLRLALRQ